MAKASGDVNRWLELRTADGPYLWQMYPLSFLTDFSPPTISRMEHDEPRETTLQASNNSNDEVVLFCIRIKAACLIMSLEAAAAGK